MNGSPARACTTAHGGRAGPSGWWRVLGRRRRRAAGWAAGSTGRSGPLPARTCTSNAFGGSVKIGGTVALVTGAASGLGKAAAEQLHAASAKVVLVDTNRDADTVLADTGVGMFVSADVTNEVEVQA